MWDKIISAWTIGRYLYTLSTTTRKEREHTLSPACPMIASWAQPTGKADRTHGDVEAAWSSRQLRFGSRGLQCLLQCFRYRSD